MIQCPHCFGELPDTAWIKCSEQMPEPRVPVLTHHHSRGDGINVSYYDKIDKPKVGQYATYTQRGIVRTSPTHWMPLPEPPKDSK